MKRLFECAVLAATLVCAVPLESLAQVRQSGNITPTHAACWTAAGVIQDCGASTSPYATTFGVRNGTGTDGICVQSDVSTAAGYTRACLGTTTAGGAILGVSNFGTAPSPGFVFQINGATVLIPVISGATVSGDGACFNNTSGTLIDCGFPPASGTLTSGHIFVGNASNVATDFGTLATFASTGGMTISPSSGNVLTLNPAFATSDRGLTISQDGPRSGTFGTNLNLNQIIINSDNANVTSANNFTYGLYTEMTTGGGSTHGSKSTFGALMNFATSSTTDGDNIAGTFVAQASAPNGGTNTGAGAAGTLFALSAVSHLASGGTNYFSVSGAEIDVGIETGGSAKHRLGWSMIGIGSVAAASIDTAFEISAAGQAFKHALILTDLHGGFGLTTAGTVIGTNIGGATPTIANGIDLSGVTISAFFLKGAASNFTVDGSGNIVGPQLTAPLLIGGSGTTGTQLTFKTTTGVGTTDVFAWVGGNNGATTFATLGTTTFTVNSSIAVNGTAGAGYLALGSQSSNPSAASGSNVRLFASSAGNLSWIKADGFVRSFTSTLTADRIYTLPDFAGTIAVPSTVGTTTTVLHGNASGQPTYGAVSLTADITGTLAGVNGGTGLSTAAVGDIIYASATTPTWSRLADVAVGSILVSGGVSTAPAWSATPTIGGLTKITTNTTSITPDANTMLQIVAVDAQTVTEVEVRNYGGAGNTIRGYYALGTAASPSAISGGGTIWNLAAFGYGTSFAASPDAAIKILAAENFAAGAHGTAITFTTTPTTTTSPAEAARVQASGGFSIGATTDPGIGGLYVNGATITLNGLATDATHTDRTVCQDTTSKSLFFGSGAAGICLGTSSARFKHDIVPLAVGLDQIEKLQAIAYRLNADYGDPDKLLYGFTAEQGLAVLPDLVGRDTSGQPQTFDYMGVVPVLVRAVQQLKADNDNLRQEIRKLGASR